MEEPPKASPSLSHNNTKIPHHDSDEEIDQNIDEFHGNYDEQKDPKIISPSRDTKSSNNNESEIPKNLGIQARLSSEARYTQFADYVLRKISAQVIKSAKKGLWKTEIFLTNSPWSRDPENQRRILASLAKQELSARAFPAHNKKIRLLIWWSPEPPIAFEMPFVSKKSKKKKKKEPGNEADLSSNSNANNSDERSISNIQKAPAVIKKRDIALEEDSSSSSASVIETDFKQHRKVIKKIRKDKRRKARDVEKAKRKKDKVQQRMREQNLKKENRFTRRKNTSSESEDESEDSKSDSDSSLNLCTSSDEERKPKRAKNNQYKERRNEKQREDRKGIESDEDLLISQLKIEDKQKRSH